VQSSDTRFVAVGELSTIVRMPRNGTQMELVSPGNLPPGDLSFIAGNDKAGWYVLQRVDSDVNLLHSPRLEDGDWTTVRTESVAFSRTHGITRVWAWRTANGLAYATTSGGVDFLDFASGAWTHRDSPNKARFIDIALNPDGSFGALTAASGIFSSPGGALGDIRASAWLSRDNATTWQEIKSPFTIKRTTPIRTPDGRLLLAGEVSGTTELDVSEDNGSTWHKSSNRIPTILPNGIYLYAEYGENGQFSISTSADKGQTWKVEYSNN